MGCDKWWHFGTSFSYRFMEAIRVHSLIPRMSSVVLLSAACNRMLLMSMGRDDLSEMRPRASLLFIPQVIYEWKATMEWYWQGNTEELEEKPFPVPLCPPKISHTLTRARIRASAVTGPENNHLNHGMATNRVLIGQGWETFSVCRHKNRFKVDI
jgi:hypothetical protein